MYVKQLENKKNLLSKQKGPQSYGGLQKTFQSII